MISRITFFFLAFIFNAQGQDGIDKLRPGQLKSFGKNAVSMGDYFSAATYYDRYCKLKPKDYKVAFNLAECYRLSKDYRNAEDAYLKAYNLKPDKNALALFHYATMLKTNGNYEKADEYYTKFKKEYKGADKSDYLKLIKNNAKAAEFSKNIIQKPLKISINHLDASINTSHVEASPVYVNDSTIIYGSLKTDMNFFNFNPEDSSSNEPYRKLYKATIQENNWKDAGEFPGPFNAEGFHTTNGVFSADGKRFYFTRCKRNNKNKIICAIYVSANENGEWQQPVSLGKEVNDPQYTSSQPAVGVESKKNGEIIYFISDRTGGRGGLDIWYTAYDAKKKVYKAPSNAGSKINTVGDDITPYYDLQTHTLYFSSEGWQGLGGLDVFKTNGELKTWSPPENLGYPVNTGFDDLYYVLNKNDKEKGFFVSNRNSGDVATNKAACCDDIFSFQYLESTHFNVNGTLTEERDSVDSASAIGNIPLDKANVFLEVMNEEDSTYVPINNVVTDENGKYKMEVVPGKNYRLSVKRDGYLISTKEFTTKNQLTPNITADLSTSRIPENAIALKNIYYEYGKATLTEAAKNSIDTTLLLILNNNPELAIEMSSHTDNIGNDESNLTLSQKRAESVVNYLEAKGIDKKRLRAKGYGESQPIAPNQNKDGSDSPEGRQMNRRTEFKVIGKVRSDGTVREEKTF
ncbi:MAG: OmpA family protein [Bacteroidia bacterium]